MLTIPVDKAVIGGIVDAAEGEGRPHVVALCRVVVDDVEDDLDVGGVQRLHHRLELGHLCSRVLCGRVTVVRGEVADRVVAPVVRQSLGLQRRIVRELLDRHELNRGDAQLRQVFDNCRVRHAGVGAAQLLRDVRVTHRHALDVGLVDDRLGVVVARAVVALPVEEGVDDDGVHCRVGGIAALERQGIIHLIRKEVQRIFQLALDRLCVGVKKELRRVTTQTVLGIPGAVDAVAVKLAGAHLWDIDVPYVGIDLRHGDAHFVEVVVQEAQRHRRCDRGVDREVRSGSVKGGTQGVGLARSRFHTDKPRTNVYRLGDNPPENERVTWITGLWFCVLARSSVKVLPVAKNG